MGPPLGAAGRILNGHSEAVELVPDLVCQVELLGASQVCSNIDQQVDEWRYVRLLMRTRRLESEAENSCKLAKHTLSIRHIASPPIGIRSALSDSRPTAIRS